MSFAFERCWFVVWGVVFVRCVSLADLFVVLSVDQSNPRFKLNSSCFLAERKGRENIEIGPIVTGVICLPWAKPWADPRGSRLLRTPVEALVFTRRVSLQKKRRDGDAGGVNPQTDGLSWMKKNSASGQIFSPDGGDV